ncbi:MAG: hypothetical protein IJS14_00120 [Lentisphaeria bacterium]|nr:hypothetical protein [Lentisphaeria bacterium]
MLTVISIALMVAGLVGIVVCQKKQKTNPNAQALAFVFLIVILAGAGVMIYDTFTGEDRMVAQMQANELAYSKSWCKVLSDYAGKTWAGKSAVIITEPKVEGTNKTIIDTLQEDLKAAGLTVAAVEALNIPAGEEDAPMMEAVEAKHYNEIFAKYPSAAVFVITTNLPQEGKELKLLKCWTFNPKAQCIVLANQEINSFKPMIERGFIGAAVTTNPNYQPTEEIKKAPADPKAAFDERYILITTANVKEMAEQFKDIFAK